MTLIRINTNPSRKQLLVFGLAWLVFLGGLGLSLWSKDRHQPAAVIGTLAIVVPLAGLAWPRGLRHVYVGLTYATYPIGFVVSHIVLALLYYLVLTPIGLVMKLGGYDPLARRFEPKSPSYWKRRDDPKPAGSYLRQI